MELESFSLGVRETPRHQKAYVILYSIIPLSLGSFCIFMGLCFCMGLVMSLDHLVDG